MQAKVFAALRGPCTAVGRQAGAAPFLSRRAERLGSEHLLRAERKWMCGRDVCDRMEIIKETRPLAAAKEGCAYEWLEDRRAGMFRCGAR